MNRNEYGSAPCRPETMQAYGFDPRSRPETIQGIPARITAVHRGLFEIVCDKGCGFAHVKPGAYRNRKNDHPTVGDFVTIDWEPDGESRILATLSRTSYFSRRDPSSAGHGEQAVAANFDYVFVVQALDRDFNERRLERYLALAWQSGATPVVVLTKADCANDVETQVQIAESLALGVDVFALSVRTGEGMGHLERYLAPRTTIVLLGSSGVGKTSLVNALAGEDVHATGEVRASDGRGRHTTSCRQLIMLDGGAMLIDTPGMRELGMWEADDGIAQGFADVEQYFGACKFRDCNHDGEPGCAIVEAIRKGELAPERWESYRKLKTETRLSRDKEGFLREKRQWEKSLSKQIRQMKQPGRTDMPDYRHEACDETFACAVCGAVVVPEHAGSSHRNHCPQCLSSVHVDNKPGDRASLCKGVMEPIGVWVRKNGEWALIHRCSSCGKIVSNRIAADDNSVLLMSIATKPLANPPFPLWDVGGQQAAMG
ncbi:ribosome small subunit-dependent GTPase A [Raoultibacter phocaeensis]|uniref:ribosome small subunit-dependent GTPase A n=1 Tax=Raoultibacter phocaeensis TaxID=2479841 RepID=UPI001C56F6B4|nr:ribosome small subunit-dependent GTPase A [Raoultibacter phocaeensis]